MSSDEAPTPVTTPTPTPFPTPEPTPPEPAVDPKEGNCYGHCALCYNGDAAKALNKNGAPDPAALARYFEPPRMVEEGTTANLEPGDFVWWNDPNPASSSAGHAGIATGNGDEVSQYGFPIEYWHIRGKEKTGKLTADEKKKRDQYHAQPIGHHRLKAGELTPLIYDAEWRKKNPGRKPFYQVYRIKPEYRDLLDCRHSKVAHLDFSYKHLRMNAYPGGERYTDYELKYSLKQVSPDTKELDEWTGPLRVLGGHTHYGWQGGASIEVPLDWVERGSAAFLRSYVEQFAVPPWQRAGSGVV